MNGEIQNVSFGLYAAADLTADDGSTIPADGILEIAPVPPMVRLPLKPICGWL